MESLATGDLVADIMALIGVMIVVFTQLKKEWDVRRNGRAVITKEDVAQQRRCFESVVANAKELENVKRLIAELKGVQGEVKSFLQSENQRHLVKDIATRIAHDRRGSTTSAPEIPRLGGGVVEVPIEPGPSSATLAQ